MFSCVTATPYIPPANLGGAGGVPSLYRHVRKPLTGTLPSDSIVAAVHSTNPNELLSLFVLKYERRTLQGHALLYRHHHPSPRDSVSQRTRS